uniref:Uncharacterized protein n=1 Tax=Aegilops tauschii subsp. strangulata TaxID=200361 RepID=A0A453CPW6_AEGTS
QIEATLPKQQNRGGAGAPAAHHVLLICKYMCQFHLPVSILFSTWISLYLFRFRHCATEDCVY